MNETPEVLPQYSEVLLFTSRLDDGGPVYTETRLERLVVEPWNAASALLFVGIVVYWLLRLRGRYARYPFLSCSLPILLAGGIGGTLYHATRSSYVFFLMDVFPIVVLCLATSIFLWTRLLPRWWYALALLLPYFAVQRLGFFYLQSHQAINLSYVLLALLIVLPLAIQVVKQRFRHALWPAAALAAFVIALTCRYADAWQPALLPMGTHWLWHTFGAMACLALAEYLYLLEAERPSARLLTVPETIAA